MASLQQHDQDCLKFLGEPFDEVNRWIDEYFATHGPTHRKFRHHREGIGEARELFGNRGATAAAIHVLRDCRNIPRKEDYESGKVDLLGLKRHWSTVAYVKYSEEDFESLVDQFLKPSGLVQWAFVDLPTLQSILSSLSLLDPATVQKIISQWPKAVSYRESLSPFVIDPAAIEAAEITNPIVAEHLKSISENPSFKAVLHKVSFATVKLSQLINPLVFIDHEYLDGLKPELSSLDEEDVIKFAIPQTLNMQGKVMMDPTLRSVIFVSNEKILTVGPAELTPTPLGTEVKFVVGARPSAILVVRNSGRLYIRNGIHRAYLLAQLGQESAPCILVEEEGPLPINSIAAYPTFTPAVLSLPRPPMLTDFLNSELTLEIPLQRTHKVVRITAEETIIPID